MEHRCSERNIYPTVVSRFMGLEEMMDNLTLTSQRNGGLYLSQSEEIMVS